RNLVRQSQIPAKVVRATQSTEGICKLSCGNVSPAIAIREVEMSEGRILHGGRERVKDGIPENSQPLRFVLLLLRRARRGPVHEVKLSEPLQGAFDSVHDSITPHDLKHVIQTGSYRFAAHGNAGRMNQVACLTAKRHSQLFQPGFETLGTPTLQRLVS